MQTSVKLVSEINELINIYGELPVVFHCFIGYSAESSYISYGNYYITVNNTMLIDGDLHYPVQNVYQFDELIETELVQAIIIHIRE